jgi:hypothetical protein
MSSTTRGYYNKAGDEMADRVHKRMQMSYADLSKEMGIQWNFHLAADHDPAKIDFVLNCLAAGKEFILYLDKNNYTIFIPDKCAAIGYHKGVEQGIEVADSHKNWQERIKMGMMMYPHYFTTQTMVDVQTPALLQL